MMAKFEVVSVRVVVVGLAAAMFSLSCWGADGNGLDQAMSLKPDMENGRDVYEICSACHLPEGWGVKEGEFPQLAGQHRSVVIKQLSDIRNKKRDNPTMYPFSLPESIGDEQSVADVAAYIEQLKMNPDNGKGEWAEGTVEFEMGKRLFRQSCVACHGENGEGNAEQLFPKLQGQHYNYMLRQIKWILEGKRRGVAPGMVATIKGFSDEDMAKIINYVSRIQVPKDMLAPSVDWKNPDFE